MKKIFLHIGFNKTGSTSLQRNLSENSAALQHQGILYPYDPSAPYMQRWQHLPLAAAIPGRNVAWLLPKNRAGLAQAYSALKERITASSCNTVVLSSESFGDLDMRRQKVEWLASQFAGFDVTVVAYIRRQDSYFLSTYQEGVKAGRSDLFDFGTHREAKMLYFARRLAPWREVFGAERVIVRPFDPQHWPEGELFFDFLKLTGAQCSGLFVAPPENEGMDWRALELLRRLNALNVPLPQGRRRELAALFARMLTGERQKMALSSEQAEALRVHFSGDNAVALAASGLDAVAFFPPPPPGRSARLLPADLQSEELLQLIARLAAAPRSSA